MYDDAAAASSSLPQPSPSLVPGTSLTGWLQVKKPKETKIRKHPIKITFDHVATDLSQSAPAALAALYNISDSDSESNSDSDSDLPDDAEAESDDLETANPSSSIKPAAPSTTHSSSAASTSGRCINVKGLITFSKKGKSNTTKASFKGTADPITGAFEIYGRSRSKRKFTFTARRSQQPIEEPISSSSMAAVPEARSLLVGYASRISHLSPLIAFWIDHSSTPWPQLPSKETAAHSSSPSVTASPSLPYSDLLYVGRIEHGEVRQPVTFLAKVSQQENSPSTYDVQGYIRVMEGAVHNSIFTFTGQWSVEKGLRMKVKCQKVHSAENSVSLDGEWRCSCKLDTSDESHALSVICAAPFDNRHFLSQDIMNAFLNGWSDDTLPRQKIKAELIVENSASNSQTPIRLKLYSLPHRLPLHSSDGVFYHDFARDELGRAHGYSLSSLDVGLVVYEYHHGTIVAAKLYADSCMKHPYTIHHGMSGNLNFIPTSIAGIWMGVPNPKDRYLMKPFPVVTEILIPGFTFCGISNIDEGYEGVLLSNELVSADSNWLGELRFPSPFPDDAGGPFEQFSSKSGNIWIGKWTKKGRAAMGEQFYANSQQIWFLRRYSKRGVNNFSEIPVPNSEHEYLWKTVQEHINKMQRSLRDLRLQADEHLRTFDERAKDSVQYQTLNPGQFRRLQLDRGNDLPLPITRHVVSLNNVETLADCGLFQTQESSLMHLRDLPHGFAFRYDLAVHATSSPLLDERTGIRRGPMMYQGDLYLGHELGFGHSIQNTPLQVEHRLGWSQFSIRRGLNARWIFKQPSSNTAAATASEASASAPAMSPQQQQQFQLQTTMVNFCSSATYHPGALVDLEDSSNPSSSIGYFGSDNQQPMGIALQRFCKFARLALWCRSPTKQGQYKHGPYFELDYTSELRLYDQSKTDSRKAFEVKLFNDPIKARVHSSHPLLIQMCASIERQATDFDGMLLTWFQATAKFDEKRRRFLAMPITDSKKKYSGFLCSRCNVNLSEGNQWKCINENCCVILCSLCKGDSAWGCIINGHDHTHVSLFPLVRSSTAKSSLHDNQQPQEQPKEADDMTEAETSSPKKTAAPKKQKSTSGRTHLNMIRARAFQLNKKRSTSEIDSFIQSERPSLPATLDLSFDGQAEATFLGPAIQDALNKYLPRDSEQEASIAAPSRSHSAAALHHIALASSELEEEEKESKDLRPPSQRLDPSSISISMLLAPASGAPSSITPSPTIRNILDQLEMLLRQSADLVSLRDESTILDAIPATLEDNIPAHLGSKWHQLLGPTLRNYQPWAFIRLQSKGAREIFHLFLLARIRSLCPLLQWLRDRCRATVGNQVEPQEDVPPLRLSNSSIVRLTVILRHYGELLRLVSEEIAERPRQSSSWFKRTRAAVRESYNDIYNGTFNKLTCNLEYADTSTLPALHLWIRLLDTKDLIIACIPLLQD